MVRLLHVPLTLVLCVSIHAGVLPARRIDRSGVAPTLQSQTSVSLTSSGSGAFAVWSDFRSSYDGSLIGTRLSGDGTVLDPTGLLIDAEIGLTPSVVWNGWGYTAIAAERRSNPYARQRLFLYRLDKDGGLIGGRIPLGEIEVPSLASDGAGEVALGGDTGGGSTVSFFDRDTDGQPLAVKSVGVYAPVPVADQGGWFAFAEDDVCQKPDYNCRTVLKQYAFGQDHAVARETALFDYDRDPASLSVASNGAGRFLLAWSRTETIDLERQQYKRRVFYAVVDREGNVLSDPIRIELTDVDVASTVLVWGSMLRHPPDVAWNGRHFVVTWEWFDGSGSTAMRAIRIDPDGNRIDSSPVAFGASLTKHIKEGLAPVAVQTEDDFIVAWCAPAADRDEVVRGVARSVRSIEALAYDVAPELLTSSPTAQSGVQIAVSDRSVFAVWAEDETIIARLLPLSGRSSSSRLVVSAESTRAADLPAVAWGGGTFVVVWHETSWVKDRQIRTGDHIYMRRYDEDGHPLDPEPVRLAVDPVRAWVLGYYRQIDIGFDGAGFLAVWGCDGDGAVHGARIPISGDVSGKALILSRTTGFRIRGAKLTWTGTDYVLLFQHDTTPPAYGDYGPVVTQMTRLSAEGKVLDPTYPTLLTLPHDHDIDNSPVEPSWNGSELLATWATYQNEVLPYQSCAYTQRFTATGAMIDPEPVKLICQTGIGFSTHFNPRPLWDGSRWWLYYSKKASDGGVFLAPLTGAGLDGEPTRLVGGTSRPAAADAIFTPTGLVFAYEGADDENGGSYAGFWSRMISPRTRGVRH